MCDSYRPDPRRPYHDSDKPDTARAWRRRSRHEDEYRGDAPRAPRDFGYNAFDANDHDDRQKVWHPEHPEYSRSDYLRFNTQEPRYDNGRGVGPVPKGFLPETGENDVANKKEPWEFVLVRGLKPSTKEDLFAKGMEKFYQGFDDVTDGAEAKSLKRVFLIRERYSDQSMGYGFAEYHSTRDAEGAVNKAGKLRIAKKCTISSCNIMLNFPHKNIFTPASTGKPESNSKYTFALRESEFWTYRHERYYASEFVVNSEPPEPNPLFKILGARPFVLGYENATEKELMKAGSKRSMETLESKAKKAKGPAATVPAVLQKWQKKSAELRGGEEQSAAVEPKEPESNVSKITAVTSQSSDIEDEQTFAYDGETIGCYLCGSVFTTREGLLKHLNESKLHASNLNDDKICKRGYDRLKQNGIDPKTTIKLPKPLAKQPAPLGTGSDETSGKYRDRAAERRQEESKTEPKKIGFSLKDATQKKKGGNASYPSPDNESSKPTYGKGMNMLQKAGWSEGKGLGTGGGITAPIDQSMYASGVGLGHESSKKGDAVEEASRMTKDDRGAFLEKTKEAARKRYEQME